MGKAIHFCAYLVFN